MTTLPRVPYFQLQNICPKDKAPILTDNGDLNAIRKIKIYLDDFLTKPHPNLGRNGTVCPFMPMSLKKNLSYIGVVKGSPDKETIHMLVGQMRETYLEICQTVPEKDRQFVTMGMLFPDMKQDECPEKIDEVQSSRKLEFIQQGLMLGSFHAQQAGAGLHNPEFKPFRTLIPMLAMHELTAHDIVFLKDAPPEYMRAYKAKFPDKPGKCPMGHG